MNRERLAWRKTLDDWKARVMPKEISSEKALEAPSLEFSTEDGINAERLSALIDSTIAKYQSSVTWQLTHLENIRQVLKPLLRQLFSNVAIEVQNGILGNHDSTSIALDDEAAVDHVVSRVSEMYEAVVTHLRTHENNIKLGLKPIVVQTVYEFAHQQRERTLKRQQDVSSPRNPALQSHKRVNEGELQSMLNKLLVDYSQLCTWRLTHEEMVFNILEPRLKQFFIQYLSSVLPTYVITRRSFEASTVLCRYVRKGHSERLRSRASLAKKLESSVESNNLEGQQVTFSTLVQLASHDVCLRYFDAIVLRLTHQQNIDKVLRPILDSTMRKLCQDVMNTTDSADLERKKSENTIVKNMNDLEQSSLTSAIDNTKEGSKEQQDGHTRELSSARTTPADSSRSNAAGRSSPLINRSYNELVEQDEEAPQQQDPNNAPFVVVGTATEVEPACENMLTL